MGMSKMVFPSIEDLALRDFCAMLVMFGPCIRAGDDVGDPFRSRLLLFSFFTGNAPDGCWGFVVLLSFVCVLHPFPLRGDDLVDEFGEEGRRPHGGDCFASVHGSYCVSKKLSVRELVLLCQKLEKVRLYACVDEIPDLVRGCGRNTSVGDLWAHVVRVQFLCVVKLLVVLLVGFLRVPLFGALLLLDHVDVAVRGCSACCVVCASGDL